MGKDGTYKKGPKSERSGSSKNLTGKKKSAADAESIGVFARLKPVGNGVERGDIAIKSRFGKAKSMQVKNLEFTLDWMFAEDVAQEEVYEYSATDRVEAVLNGYNATLMAYGQTGSGKTHTMFGPDEVLQNFTRCDPALWGLVPRATEQLFEGLANGPDDSTFLLQVSYIEVYNDRLNDLIFEEQNMLLRETPHGGLKIDGLKYATVHTPRQVMENLAKGNARRVVAAMSMNARSSRGHAIFTIYVKEMTNAGAERNGKLNLVDLAGMESSKKSYAVKGASNTEARREEAKNINVSLYALGSVISALSAASRKKGGGDGEYVPWRNSKLTRLLQDSLGGNSKSTIVVTLRTEAENIEETIQTLRFAQRAKAVKTIVKESLLNFTPAQLQAQIEQLNEQLETSQLLCRRQKQQIEDYEAHEQKTQAKVAEGGGQSTDEALEHALKRNKKLRREAILHRILMGQSVRTIEQLREENTTLQQSVAEHDAGIRKRDRETKTLKAEAGEILRRVEMLEELIAQSGGGAITVPPREPGFAAHFAVGQEGNDLFEEDMTDTELQMLAIDRELKEAMAGDDAERLKAAIVAASEAISQERAKQSNVIQSDQMVGSKQAGSMKRMTQRPTALRKSRSPAFYTDDDDDDETPDERKYREFQEMYDERRNELDARGFEVQAGSLFSDELLKTALDFVPQAEWADFIRLELPSPRDEDIDDEGHVQFAAEEVPHEYDKFQWARRASELKHRGLVDISQRTALIELPDGVMQELIAAQQQTHNIHKRGDRRRPPMQERSMQERSHAHLDHHLANMALTHPLFNDVDEGAQAAPAPAADVD